MKREKVYIAAIACCCWMTTACESSSNSSDDMTPVEGATSTERAIGFVPKLTDAEGSTARLTRAAGDGELTTELLQQKGFGVYCWYTSTYEFDEIDNDPETAVKKVMLMKNQRVTYNGALWTYSPAKYWPLADNEKLTFRAYAPYVSYQLQTDSKGLPLLPVVVTKDDYHNGTQHDPLWGTGRLVQGSSDTTPGEYYPKPDPSDLDQSKSSIYGQHYDNMTYKMSGDYRLKNDTRDGTIDWYFHHGMASLMFTCSVIANPGCDQVIIRSISVSPLYDMGLLDLSSPTANKDQKPWWYDRDGNMTVELTENDPNTTAGDLAASPVQEGEYTPYPFTIKTGSTATAPAPLLDKGLLIIPRDYSGSNPKMVVTVKYTIDNEADVQTAIGYIPNRTFYGNTSYKIGLTLTPATKGLEIELVQMAFTNWQDDITKEHEVYNW